MTRFTLFLRRVLYFCGPCNTKALRVLVLALVFVTLTLVGIRQASGYMEKDLLPVSMNSYLDRLSGTSHVEYFDKNKLREMMNFTMKKVRAHSSPVAVSKVRGKDCQLEDIGVSDVEKFYKTTKEELSKCIHLPEETLQQLKESHDGFLDTLIKEILQEYPTDLYGGEGITIVGGGKYTLYAMLAIKAIRTNGDRTIPIELMLPLENNDESAFCENVLPEVDPSGSSRCIYLNDVFDSETLKDVKGYQLKALALLGSSFEKVLLLDADNYVVNSMAGIFKNPFFQEFGLILWPDYWRRLHHPRLYDVAGIPVNENKRTRYSFDDASRSELFTEKSKSKIPFHDFDGAIPDGGTESGQLLVDKSQHLGTIILSLYYNYNGPSQYYPLLGQGFSGEGDKDTFALAANTLTQRGVLSEYHQVKTPVGTTGYFCNSKDESRIHDEDQVPQSEQRFRGVAMLQHDLYGEFKAYMNAKHDLHDSYVEDFHLFRHRLLNQRPSEENGNNEEIAKWEKKVYDDFWDSHKVAYDLKDFSNYFNDVPVLFTHSHLPKYDPWMLSETGDLKYDGKKVMEKHSDEQNFKPSRHGHYRMYNDNFKEKTNYDLELANFIILRDHICRIEQGYKNFSYLSQKVNNDEKGLEKYNAMCDYIAERVDMLLNTTWTGSIYQ